MACKHKKNENGFCIKGCDCVEARGFDRKEIEKKLGIEFGQPFFVLQGLRLIADGYEEPYVRIELGGKRLDFSEEEMLVLHSAIREGLKWCRDGWCPGSC